MNLFKETTLEKQYIGMPFKDAEIHAKECCSDNLMRYHAFLYTVISRKVVGKNVHATIPKGNMGYDQYTVPDDCSCRTKQEGILYRHASIWAVEGPQRHFL